MEWGGRGEGGAWGEEKRVPPRVCAAFESGASGTDARLFRRARGGRASMPLPHGRQKEPGGVRDCRTLPP